MDKNFYEECNKSEVTEQTGWKDRFWKSLEIIKELKPKRLLDAGCRHGFFSLRIKQETGAEVHGVDISDNALKSAIKKGIICKQSDLSKKIPHHSETFDVVFSGEVIEHLQDPDAFLCECWRVLKPGGYLVLSTPNMASWYNRILLLFGIQPIFSEVSSKKTLGRKFRFFGQGSNAVGHLRLYTLLGLKDLLELCDFRLVRSVGAFIPSIPLSFIDDFFSFFPSLSSALIIVAVKPKADVVK
ncbi:MAG: class I SAM-dependent methyltransferase [Candidatus Omnitrophica bacterium]|nr:class I SAM-dependent methyltransferase [Candidatus Omnitrophota bacterium]